MVAAGVLGRIWRISAQLGAGIAGYEASRDGDTQNYPGGIWFTLGCHLLDQVVAFLGPPVEVTGVLRPDGRSAHVPSFDDNNLAILAYERALATIETWNLEAGENGVHRRFEVYGERGTILISPLEPPRVRLYLAEPYEAFIAGWQDVAVGDRPRYEGDLEHFLACIRGERAPLYPHAHDLAAHEALLRVCGLPI